MDLWRDPLRGFSLFKGVLSIDEDKLIKVQHESASVREAVLLCILDEFIAFGAVGSR